MIEGVQSTLRPEHPFSVRDIRYFYDQLLGSRGIKTVSIVFDTPLPVYDMDQKNRILLNDPDVKKNTNHRIVPFAVITPDMNDKQIQLYLEMGAKGFKITPRTPSSQVKKKTVNDISLFEMIHPSALRLADDNKLPVIVHLPQLVVSPRNRASIKEELADIVMTYPHLKIILAHLGQAQTPARIKDMLLWIQSNNFEDFIWMDISAVSVSSVLANALAGNIKLLFGTDIDFALVEYGRYVAYKVINGKRILAEDDISDKVITALVSTHFGQQLKKFVLSQVIDLDVPLFLAQLVGILDAVDTLKKSGAPDVRIKSILEGLFFKNAEQLLKANSKESAFDIRYGDTGKQ